jgi:hypothetical protein
MAEILRMTVPLAVGTLDDVTSVARRLEADSTLLKVFHLVDIFIIWCSLKVQEEHGERLFGSRMLGIPDVKDGVP